MQIKLYAKLLENPVPLGFWADHDKRVAIRPIHLNFSKWVIGHGFDRYSEKAYWDGTEFSSHTDAKIFDSPEEAFADLKANYRESEDR